MLDSTDVLKIIAATFAARKLLVAEENDSDLGDALRDSVMDFGIVYGKMLEEKLDAKVENLLRVRSVNE